MDLTRGKMAKTLTSLQKGTSSLLPFSHINPFYFPSPSNACNAGKAKRISYYITNHAKRIKWILQRIYNLVPAKYFSILKNSEAAAKKCWTLILLFGAFLARMECLPKGFARRWWSANVKAFVFNKVNTKKCLINRSTLFTGTGLEVFTMKSEIYKKNQLFIGSGWSTLCPCFSNSALKIKETNEIKEGTLPGLLQR